MNQLIQRSTWTTVLILLTHVTTAHARANGHMALSKLTKEFWDWRMQDNPSYSTSLGYYGFNDLLQSYNFTIANDRYLSVKNILDKLEGIPDTDLTFDERVTYDVLNDTLSTFVEGKKFSHCENLNPISFLEGIHIYFSLVKASTNTIGDYENYLARMARFPFQIIEIIDGMKEAIRVGAAFNNVSVAPIPGQIDDLIKNDPVQSTFYSDFSETLDNTTTISQTLKNSLKRRGKEAVVTVQKAFIKLRDFLLKTYMPHTKNTYSVADSCGPAHYQECLRWHLSFDMTPEAIHELGHKEVDRIYKEMTKIMDSQGFHGNVRDYYLQLESNPKFILNTGEEIIQRYEDIIHNKITNVLPKYFRDIPDVPIEVKASSTDGIGGGYSAATEDSPGIFSINLFRPKENPTFGFTSLALHESIPGHHLQQIYALQAKLPAFQSQAEFVLSPVPFAFPVYSAYTEGWALYSEYLGEEMGLYETDYDLMGRYSDEMLRAVRLVLDTGLHHYGWSQSYSVQYMMNYTAMSFEAATIEVNRYITWPGQACAYKLGEIKIKELRSKAEKKLGSLFDIREFHMAVLKNGAVPLRVLERLVDHYIQDTLSTTQSVSNADVLIISTFVICLSFLLQFLFA